MINSNFAALAPEMESVTSECVRSVVISLPSGATLTLFGYLTEETEENMRIIAPDKVPISMTPVTLQALQDCEEVSRITTPNKTDLLPQTDAIVLLTHQFVPNDIQTLQKTSQYVSAILGGHEHDSFLLTVDGIPISKAGNDMAYCSVLYLDFIPTEDVFQAVTIQEEEKGIEVSTQPEMSTENQIVTFISSSYDITKCSTPPTKPKKLTQTSKFSVSSMIQLVHMEHLSTHAQNPSIPSAYLEPYPSLIQLKEEGDMIIQESGNEVLYEFPNDGVIYSSKDVRNGPNSLATFLCDVVKFSQGTDLVLLPSGKVRGNKNYSHSMSAPNTNFEEQKDGVEFERTPSKTVFTMIDALSELPFPDNEFVIVNCTGEDILKVLGFSYSYHRSRGGFLQTDSGVEYNAGVLKKINGEPFSQDKIYKLGVPLTQLRGMDNNPMLMHIGVESHADQICASDLPLLQHIVINQLQKIRAANQPSIRI